MVASPRGVPRRPTAPADNDARLARRSRWAGGGMVLILLGVSMFAVWSSQVTGTAANRAIAASSLSDSYADAATAIAAEESWERKYRLEPGPEVEAGFDIAATAFVGAMRAVRRAGGLTDQAVVDRALLRHRDYLAAVDRLFRARDRGDERQVRRLDRDEADPPFQIIEKTVLTAADTAQATSMTELNHLKSQERLSRLLTPLVFLLGLVIAGLLALVTRGHRRMLVEERAHAMHESVHDPLTGLPNRTLLNDRLDRLLRSDVRAETKTGLLLIDLDRFKEINDTFGHQYGDALLKQIGPRLTGVLRHGDTVARLGGDEFAVLLSEVHSVDDALGVAAKLRAALTPAFRIYGVDLNMDASVGVVVSGQHGRDATTLLQRADIAMYVAKAQSLGVNAYDPDVDDHSPVRLALLGELRKALDRHELVLHYQPKIAVDTGDLVGVEALVRWDHRERGLILPDDFIPLAEHTELIGPLTSYVLDAALSQARTWSDEGEALQVSVNLSARNLLDGQLPDLVADLLTKHGVDPRLLMLEVTESALMTDPLRAASILARLAEMHVRISIDDFGAGYTSLSQLKALPISELKIDRSFVTSMGEDQTNAVIVSGVIDLGHNLGLSIVAEGVETEGVLGDLRGFGCDVAQGYHFSRPVTAHAFDAWRAAHLRASAAPVPG